MAITRNDSSARMSQSVVHGDTVYLAGQVADTGTGDITVQTKEVLAKIDKLLATAGTGKSNLLSAAIFITDMRNFQGMNAVWDEWVDSTNPPARATVEARLARTDLLVEIVIVAAL